MNVLLFNFLYFGLCSLVQLQKIPCGNSSGVSPWVLLPFSRIDKSIITTEINDARNSYALGKFDSYTVANMQLVIWDNEFEDYAKCFLQNYNENPHLVINIKTYLNPGQYFRSIKVDKSMQLKDFIIPVLKDLLNYKSNGSENCFDPNFKYIGCAAASYKDQNSATIMGIKCITNEDLKKPLIRDLSHKEPCDCPRPIDCNGLVYDGLCGLSGPRGQKGEPGAIGNIGKLGYMGGKGSKGLQGPIGLRGDPGSQSQYGVKGMTGDKGEVGPKGSPGVQGSKGTIGPKGQKGNIGPRGEKGQPGIQGKEGYVVAKSMEFYQDYIFWILYLIPLIGLIINIKTFLNSLNALKPDQNVLVQQTFDQALIMEDIRADNQ